ncbi:MAG: hypothetical protein WCI20_02235 [bacterium]
MTALTQRCRFPETRSGQALVEATIGLAIMALTWVLITHVCYMRTNHVRTVMAARHAAWLMGHKADYGAATGSFFFDNGVSLAGISEQTLPLSAVGKSWGGSGGAKLATVSFGMSPDDLETTDIFPFALLRTEIPFMPSMVLTNYLSVQSFSAWPDDVDNTWTDRGEALVGVISEIVKSIGGALEWLGSLF